MKSFKSFKGTDLLHDTGEFKFRYLIHPPTGRGLVDIVFDVLALALLGVMWLLAYKLDTISMFAEEATITLLTFFVMGNACRNIKTVQRNFRQVEVDWPTKVRYAHYLHSVGVVVPAIGIFATLSEAEVLSSSLSIVMVVGVLAYVIAMAFIFGISSISSALDIIDNL